jgi:cytoskeleton protein RodZ
MSEETVTQGAEHSENAGVGPLFRASRQRVGEELRDVAEMLRIRYPYLEAIEDGRFKDLPGQTYAVGFVRAYAEHLGLDSEEVVRRFKIEVEAGGARHDLHFPTPVAETGFPGGAIVFVGLVVAVLAYGGWYLSTTKDGFFSDLVAPLPERLAALVDGSSDEAAKPADPVSDQAAGNSENEEAATPPPEMKPESGTETADKPDVETGAEPGAARTAETASPAPETGAQEQAAAVQTEAAAAEAARAEAEAAAGKAREAAEEAAKKAAAEKAAQEAAEKAAREAAEKAAQEAAAKAEALAKAQAEAEARAVSAAAAQVETQTAAPPPAPPAPVVEAPVPAPAETASTEAPQPAPAADEPVSRIIVRATANSWIEVRDDFSNTMLVSRLLKAGERYAVPDKAGLSLHTGNAGALEILVDGAVVPAIGAGGAVLRGVQLDPGLLKSGTAAQ